MGNSGTEYADTKMKGDDMSKGKGKWSQYLKQGAIATTSTPIGGNKQINIPLKKDCGHYGNVLAFEDTATPIKFYGAGTSKGAQPIPGSIIIQLNETVLSEPLYIEGFDAPMLDKWKLVRRIRVKWNDYDIPAYDADFWQALLLQLREIAVADNSLTVLVHCLGGHGRTGTALAILAALAGVTEQPITYIRQHYCKDAVETFAQERYVRETTGYRENLYLEPESKSDPTNGIPAVSNTNLIGTPSKEVEHQNWLYTRDGWKDKGQDTEGDTEEILYCSNCNFSLIESEIRKERLDGLLLCEECRELLGLE